MAEDLQELQVAEFPGAGLGEAGVEGLQHPAQLQGAQRRGQRVVVDDRRGAARRAVGVLMGCRRLGAGGAVGQGRVGGEPGEQLGLAVQERGPRVRVGARAR